MGFVISMQAKYLGVRLGPDADSVQWSESLWKFSSAVRGVLTERLGLVGSVVLYNRHGAPTLQFLAQVSAPSKVVVKSQSSAIQRIACGPRYYLTDDALMNIRQLGMPVQCTDIERYSLAARVRVAKKCEVFLDTIAMIDEARSSDGALLAAVSDAWIESMEKDTVLFALKSALSVVEGLPIRVPEPDDAHLQKKLIAALEKLRTPRSTRAVLQKRLSKWPGDFNELAVDNMRGRMERVGKSLKLWSTVVSVLRTATRGVCTGSRFQKHDTRCRFGCGARPESVQHFFSARLLELPVRRSAHG